MSILHGYKNAFPITPNDTVTQPSSIEAIYVGGAGDVTITTQAGSATFKAPPIGTILPVKPVKVMATGTTATLLIGLWGQ